MNFQEILILIGKTIFSYFFLLIILKLMGKRELSQVSIFDIVIFLIMSELFSLALNDPHSSLLHFIVPIVVIVILEVLSAILSMKSLKIRNFLEGQTAFLIYQGKIDYKALKKNHYNIEDLMLQLRNKELQSPSEVEYAILEGNGNLNFITKKDVIVAFPHPVIMDGKIIEESIKKLQISEEQLLAQISKQGYQSVDEIFFGQWLLNGLYLLPFKELMNR